MVNTLPVLYMPSPVVANYYYSFVSSVYVCLFVGGRGSLFVCVCVCVCVFWQAFCPALFYIIVNMCVSLVNVMYMLML